MPPEKFTTKIIVKETKQIHSGTTRAGAPYTIWQLIATKPSGEAIPQNLRSFSELPLHEVLEVECELFKSEQYGDSYTVKRKGGSGSGKLTKEVKDLQDRVEKLEEVVGELLRSERQSVPGPPPAPPPTAAAPAPAPTPAPATPPPAPPPVQADPPATAPAGDDDIPF